MNDWWRNASGVVGSDYERIYRLDAAATCREVDSVLSMSEVEPRSSVLDLCCGVGRHAVELARRGFEVTGLDISPTFLDVARRKATAAGVRVAWIEGDMREMCYQGCFDLVLNLFGAWGYFASDADNEQVIHQVASALRPGGRFVLDFFNHDWIIRHFQPYAWWEVEGFHCLERRYFDILTGRHESHLVIIDENGDRREMKTSVRGYTFAEVIAMLGRAGLQVLDSFGGFDRRPFSLETPQLIVLAEKPA